MLQGSTANEEIMYDNITSEFEGVAGAASATQISDESALLSGTDEIETANAAKQPRTLLSASQWER